MMRLLLFSVALLPLCWCYGDRAKSQGIGAFSFQDTTGKRYAGSYGINDGKINKISGDDPEPFIEDFYGPNGFFTQYFDNFNSILQDLENQRRAFDAAQKAYDLTTNQNLDYSGYGPKLKKFGSFNNNNPFFGFGNIPNYANFADTSGFGGFGGFGNFGRVPNFEVPNFRMPNINIPNVPDIGFGSNFAQAAAAAGPGFTHHFDAINPPNPGIPNVNVFSRFGAPEGGSGGNFYSVSSNSYAKSKNINGEVVTEKGAETVVNNNGKLTKYSVHD